MNSGAPPSHRGRIANQVDSRESLRSMYEPKADPFFDQLKADVLEGAASLDRGEGIPADALYAKAYALIDKIEKERDED